jgi:hypothetical protein
VDVPIEEAVYAENDVEVDPQETMQWMTHHEHIFRAI